jgi:hypothetical protein
MAYLKKTMFEYNIFNNLRSIMFIVTGYSLCPFISLENLPLALNSHCFYTDINLSLKLRENL